MGCTSSQPKLPAVSQLELVVSAGCEKGIVCSRRTRTALQADREIAKELKNSQTKDAGVIKVLLLGARATRIASLATEQTRIPLFVRRNRFLWQDDAVQADENHALCRLPARGNQAIHVLPPCLQSGHVVLQREHSSERVRNHGSPRQSGQFALFKTGNCIVPDFFYYSCSGAGIWASKSQTRNRGCAFRSRPTTVLSCSLVPRCSYGRKRSRKRASTTSSCDLDCWYANATHVNCTVAFADGQLNEFDRFCVCAGAGKGSECAASVPRAQPHRSVRRRWLVSTREPSRAAACRFPSCRPSICDPVFISFTGFCLNILPTSFILTFIFLPRTLIWTGSVRAAAEDRSDAHGARPEAAVADRRSRDQSQADDSQQGQTVPAHQPREGCQEVR